MENSELRIRNLGQGLSIILCVPKLNLKGISVGASLRALGGGNSFCNYPNSLWLLCLNPGAVYLTNILLDYFSLLYCVFHNFDKIQRLDWHLLHTVDFGHRKWNIGP